MRTALEHIDGYTESRHPFGGVYYRDEVIHMINEARKEAIEECAKIASDYIIDSEEPDPDSVFEEVTNLINELK